MMNGKSLFVGFSVALAAWVSVVSDAPADGQVALVSGSPFTFQGSLETTAGPVSGDCEFEFSLWDQDAPGGTQLGSTMEFDGTSFPTVPVLNGVFTVTLQTNYLDLPTDGSLAFLEISVCCPAGPPCGTRQLLSPRQLITYAPVALTAVQLPALRTPLAASAPNIIGGHEDNTYESGMAGAVISGGGLSGEPNQVTDLWGTVSGGAGNTAGSDDAMPDINNAQFATVAGGRSNTASGEYATVGGGNNNSASGGRSTVGGGFSNIASGPFDATVGGGNGNIASQTYATVGGGTGNTATARSSTVAGGEINDATVDYAAVGGGADNTASADSATVAGGYGNTASGSGSFVGGGNINTASGSMTAIGGGQFNVTSGTHATVGGGSYNVAQAPYATIAGGGPSDPVDIAGTNNRVFDEHGTIGGGGGNRAGSDNGDPVDARYATVSGGIENIASGDRSTVAGGMANVASGYRATVGGGQSNVASGTRSTVPGGAGNIAGGDRSFAAGTFAVVRDYVATVEYPACVPTDTCGDEGTFVWADRSSGAAFESTGPNQFLIRAAGGVGINTNDPDGAMLAVYSQSSGTVGDAVIQLVADTDNNDENDTPYLMFGRDGTTDAAFLGLAGSAGNAFNEQLITGSLANALVLYNRFNEPLQFGQNGAIAMTIDDGNVGIGTTSPERELDVRGTIVAQRSPSTNAALLSMKKTGAVGPTNIQFELSHRSNNNDLWMYGYDGTTFLNLQSWDYAGNAVDFPADDGLALHLDMTNDRVGIGTTDADVKLEVNGGSELTLVDNTGYLMLGDQDGENLALDNDEIQARNNAAVADLAAQPHGGNFIVGPLGVLLVDGTNGRVGILDPTPDVELDVNGDINYTGTILDVSDERLKENITPVQDALDKVRQLRGVYFNMKDTPERRDVGLIAQDVQKILPEAVSVVDPENGYLGVSYPSVIPLLVEAMKDLQSEKDAQIAAQAKEINDLRARLEALERDGNGSVVRAGLPLALLGLAGLVALRRRAANGGGR